MPGLRVPAGHALPAIMAQWEYYGWNIARIVDVIAGSFPDLRVIDIGANIGDTAAMIRRVSDCPILCVEGVPEYLRYLAENVKFLNVEIFPGYVSIDGAADSLFAAVSDGSASASKTGPQAVGVEKITALPLEVILDQHPRFKVSKFWKIDTDGLDCPIIQASRSLIQKARPIIFFEYDPFLTQGDSAMVVWEFVRDLGYLDAVAWDNVGNYMGAYNLRDALTGNDLYAVAAGWRKLRYLDICIFHEEDHGIADAVRRKESGFAGGLSKSVNGKAEPDGSVAMDMGVRSTGRAFLRASARWLKTRHRQSEPTK